MRALFSIIFWVPLFLVPAFGVAAQEITQSPQVEINVLSPIPGQALQGKILITFEINFDPIQSAEVSFSYTEDPRHTWFLIQEIREPGDEGLSIEWDTTTLTDGEYTLRAIVFTDQDQFTGTVPNLRVRNYSAIETNTPITSSTPAPEDTLMPSGTPTTTIAPIPATPTPLPPNPAQLDIKEIGINVGIGVMFASGGLLLFGLYSFYRNRRRRD
jgi:hypothetical protein